tara:strand:+ start:3491 stop:3667 length:177 start_codon:yes stop_codon:yes gene_type:complete
MYFTEQNKDVVKAAYDKAYQESIREGARSMSDIDISIRQKMAEMGFVLAEPPSHPEFG